MLVYEAESDRFISTCVETAISELKIYVELPVHLHVRGDSAGDEGQMRMIYGSSPRAWRQRHTPPGGEGIERFISTCVETAIERGVS